jgi:SulP family sulfate permease
MAISPRVRAYLPLLDLAEVRSSDVRRDLLAALSITLLAVPQGLAYAMIAGLPPAMGLYAAMAPVIVGSLFRHSRFVVTGPTNAISLVVGSGVALAMIEGWDPATVAVTLALMVGIMQLAAGLLKLGALVDFISAPVVLGYITGAGVLIAVGQIHHLTGTVAGQGYVYGRLSGWLAGLSLLDLRSVGLSLSTAALMLGLRRLDRRLPAALLAMAAGLGLSWLAGLQSRGVMVIADLAPIPQGMPPLSAPDLALIPGLLGVAVACTVLSLVESSAVARSIASRRGESLDVSTEFTGQGLANIAAAFTGAYPTSGSLARSALSDRIGARSRLAGVLSGVMMIGVLLTLGPLVDKTPVACIAGMLMVIASDLIDLKRIRTVLGGGLGDKLAFLSTVVGCWVVSLDKAIYLGVAISLMLFLRRARMLVICPIAVDGRSRLREVTPEDGSQQCGQVRVLHVEGALFFGAAGELETALREASKDSGVEVLVLRLKRAQGLDVTTGDVLVRAAARMAGQGRSLLLVGMRPRAMERLEDMGVIDAIGADHMFPTRPGWFEAMDDALRQGIDQLEEHRCEQCPLEEYLKTRT